MNSYFEGLRKGIRVVGKNETLESFELESLKLESFAEVGKNQVKETSKETFQLRSVLSNFASLFSTSAKLSNFRLSNLKLSNFSFFPTTCIPSKCYYHPFCFLS